MGVPTDTRETFSAIGIREDLSNIIYNLSPMDTPFLNGVGKGSCDNTTFEWQTDELKTTSANRQIEGNDYSNTAATEPRRLSNYTQISATQVQTSGTAEAVDFAGRKSSQAYQLAKRAKEMKRDMETMLLDGTAKVAGSSGTARESASFCTWIGTSSTSTSPIIAASTGAGLANSGSSTYPDGTTSAGSGGASTTMTLAMVNECASRIWDLGGTPDIMMCTGTIKGTISSSSVGGGVVAAPRGDIKGKDSITAVNSVDVLVTDFGTFKVVPNRFMPSGQCDLIDYDLWSVDYLRPFRTETLAKSGDSVKQLLIAEYGLRAKNGLGNGQIKSAK
tara:strand:+ start:766 stop:1764 length:999 start_codon:yes stop_codon:yes gene_type:complete